MSPRKGEWLLTASGRQIWPLDPRPEDILVEDAAHHLANICRYGGACRRTYVVAEHSVRASYVGPPEGALRRLVHDLPEYVLGDLVRPLKHGGGFDAYRDAEEAWQEAVCVHLGLPHGSLEMPDVRYADAVMLMTEKRDLMPRTDHPWGHAQAESTPDPLPETIVPWTHEVAHFRFLDRFYELTTGKKEPAEVWTIVKKTRDLR